MFEERRNEIIDQIGSAHASYYEAKVFSGPSLHFHLRALDMARERDLAGFTEAAYAMLAAWGMHRMGPKGAKMRDYSVFESSVRKAWPVILEMQCVGVQDLQEEHWTQLERIFFTLDVMQSGTSLVGTSKVMAHVLPNLVAPVDRQYTLRLLYGTTAIRNDKVSEWKKLRNILEYFCHPVSVNPEFIWRAERWVEDRESFPWDTSALKVVDNLLVGLGHLKN